MKWEYLTGERIDCRDFEEWLNDRGAYGWELVHFEMEQGEAWCVMKRPICVGAWGSEPALQDGAAEQVLPHSTDTETP